MSEKLVMENEEIISRIRNNFNHQFPKETFDRPVDLKLHRNVLGHHIPNISESLALLLQVKMKKMGENYDPEILREAIENVNQDLDGGQIVLKNGRWVAELDSDESSS